MNEEVVEAKWPFPPYYAVGFREADGTIGRYQVQAHSIEEAQQAVKDAGGNVPLALVQPVVL